jgi:hypothetical protein
MEYDYDSMSDPKSADYQPPMTRELPQPHYHVVAFINGCLNDYDSGPIESLELAQDHFAEVAPDWETGIHLVKIEECTEDCDPDDLP